MRRRRGNEKLKLSIAHTKEEGAQKYNISARNTHASHTHTGRRSDWEADWLQPQLPPTLPICYCREKRGERTKKRGNSEMFVDQDGEINQRGGGMQSSLPAEPQGTRKQAKKRAWWRVERRK